MSKGLPFGAVLRAPSRALAALLALAASAALAQATAPPDVPPGPARIEGRVLRSEDGSPVAGAEVALYALTEEGVPGLRRTESDARGAFAFERVASDPAIGWLVGARFRGVAFPGGRVSFAPGQTEVRVEVRVDEPTTDPRALAVSELSLRLVREPEGLRAIETLTLENAGKSTYYAPPDARGSARPALATELPANATSFEMPLGVVPEGLVREGSSLRWYGPVYPGSQELSWTYTLPAAARSGTEAPSSFAFALRVPERTGRLAVLLADVGATLEGGGLAGPEDAEVSGRRVQRFTLESPRPGALPLRVSLPPARVAPEAVSLSGVQAVLRLDDTALEVNETHTLAVAGTAQVLGTPASPLLRIPLPESATRLRFGSDAPGLELTPHAEGGLAVIGSVAPGEARVEVAYQLPVSEPPARLSLRFAARVPVLSIFVADTGRLAPRSERLHRRRPMRTDDLTYLHLEAFELAPGEEVALELGLLPPRGHGQRTLALGFVALLAGVSIWLLTSPLRARTGAALASEPGASGSRQEREALYEALRDLDHDYETGKLSAEDHAGLRDELRGRALALLQAERALQASEPAPPPAPACPACAAHVDPTHRFCPQCGQPLGARAQRGEAERSSDEPGGHA